ncbi:MAG: methyl-accepting chemotaxis protein [Bacillota bacterium]
MAALINRLPLWKKFAILGLLSLLLVSAPFIMYLNESSKAIAAAKLESQGIAPTKLLFKALQLAQQHRGLSALFLNGNTAIGEQRAAKMDEADKAFDAADAFIKKNIDNRALGSAWQQIRSDWMALKEKVSQKSIPGKESFAAHTAMIKQLIALNNLVLDYYGLSFDPTFEGSYLVSATLVAMPALTETFGQMRANGAGILAAKSATPEEHALFEALIDRANERNEVLNVALEKVNATNPAVKARLAEPSLIASGSANKVIQLARTNIVKAEQFTFSPSDYFAQYTEAIDTQFKLNDAAMATLDELLRARISRLTGNNYLLSLGILGIFLLASVIGIVISRGLLKQLGGEPDYAVAVVGKIAAGDLSVAIDTKSDDQGSLLSAMKSMRDSLVNMIGQIQTDAGTIAAASSQIAAGNVNLSERTEQQASALEETASSMEELTSTVKQNGDNAQQANQMAQSACAVAVKGGAVVSEVVSTMAAIEASAKKIVDIIAVIDGIAFQTNILALNAAVEAARAGEQGRGFAVVAAEVRNLAQRSAGAAKEIKNLIGDSVERVTAGSTLVAQAGATMEDIVASVKRVTDIMSEITCATQEQIAGIEQINQAIIEMDSMTQQNAALVEQAAAAAQSLQDQARHQEQVVGVFKLSETHVMVAARADFPAAEQPRPSESRKALRLNMGRLVA